MLSSWSLWISSWSLWISMDLRAPLICPDLSSRFSWACQCARSSGKSVICAGRSLPLSNQDLGNYSLFPVWVVITCQGINNRSKSFGRRSRPDLTGSHKRKLDQITSDAPIYWEYKLTRLKRNKDLTETWWINESDIVCLPLFGLRKSLSPWCNARRRLVCQKALVQRGRGLISPPCHRKDQPLSSSFGKIKTFLSATCRFPADKNTLRDRGYASNRSPDFIFVNISCCVYMYVTHTHVSPKIQNQPTCHLEQAAPWLCTLLVIAGVDKSTSDGRTKPLHRVALRRRPAESWLRWRTMLSWSISILHWCLVLDDETLCATDHSTFRTR